MDLGGDGALIIRYDPRHIRPSVPAGRCQRGHEAVRGGRPSRRMITLYAPRTTREFDQ